MKITFITREGYDLSGARVRCYNFARELKKRGVETQVFSFADDLKAKFGDKECQMSNVEKIKLNLKAFGILKKKIGSGMIFMQRLNYHTLAPFLISLSGKNRFIFDCDDWNIREDPRYYFGFPSSKMEYLTRKIAAFSDACIASSLFLKKYLMNFNPNTFYIPTGVDTEAFYPRQIKADNKSIVFSWVGTAYHKEMGDNLKFLIDCFTELAGKNDNIFLDIVGAGRYFQEARVSLNCSGSGRIRFKEWISPDKVADYLSGIDVGLLPLIQDTKFNTAKSPTKLFEYMALAKPTVSSRIGEAANIIEHGSNGFLAKTKEEFISRMLELSLDAGLRRSMGNFARETVERKYSLNVIGRDLFEAVKSV